MPTVPVYGGQQVRTNALQPVQQREFDVSSGLQQASRALGQVAEVADRQVMRDAEAEANAADAKITADWLQWQADNAPKYQGQNAGQYEAEARKWWESAAGQYAQGTSALAQRRLADVIPRKQNQAMAGVLSRVSAEKEKFADDSAEAAMQNTIELGIDSGDIAGARQQVRTITAQQAGRKGWTPDQLAVEQQRRLGTLHLNYITRLAQQDAEKARTYYESNKGEIGAQFQGRVEQVLTAEADDQYATKFAAQNAALPLSEQLQKAGEIENPQRREKALLQIKNNQALIKLAQQEREAAASDEAWQLVGQGKRVPERTLLGMNGRERVQLQDYLRQRAEHMATQGSKPVKTDPATLAKVYDMMRDNPDEFKELRMESLAFKLAGSDLEQVARIQRDMRNPGTEKDIVSLGAQLGPYTDTMNKTDKAAFESAAFGQVIAFQQANKRPPNSEERRKILDDLKMEVITHKGMLWDSKTPKFKLTPEQQAKAAQTGGDKFTVGQVYYDANNNRAKYLGNGRWEPVK